MNPSRSSTSDDGRPEKVEQEATTEATIKRVLARELEQLMSSEGLTKAALARRVGTSRWSLYCLLDADNDAVTLGTLQKAAQAVGRRVELRLVAGTISR